MSISAHRVIRIVTEESYDTFNLWHDHKLVEFLDEHDSLFTSLNSDGMGIAEVSVETLENAVAKASELELDTDTIDALKKDIA